MPPGPPPTNGLIDRLGPRQRGAMIGACDEVELAPGQVLALPGESIAQVYFPLSGAVCLLAPMRDGHVLEALLIGREGFCGVPIALGVQHSDVRAVAQGPVRALRMRSAAFGARLGGGGPATLARVLGRYVNVLVGQLGYAAGCNRFHRVEQRVARWLLMSSDRAAGDDFVLTHETLAMTLGVRRVSVTEAAGALQRRRLIAYRRGRVTVLDAQGLERAACPCYRTDLEIYSRSLPARLRPLRG